MNRQRSDAWFARQLAHARQVLAEADKEHTPQEIADAEAALSVDPACPQRPIFEPIERRA